MTSALPERLFIEPDEGASPQNAPQVRGLPATGPDGALLTDDAEILRRDVLIHLRNQGFTFHNGGLAPPASDDKTLLRTLHADAVATKIKKTRSALARHEDGFLQRLGDPSNIDPASIRPRLVEIRSPSGADGLLWRWATLHWSIPVSSGYGRRLRFLVVDAAHGDNLIGLIGLADPVFAMRARDTAIGWAGPTQRNGLIHMMDAFVLGAVPPYQGLLAGKLMAMLATSDDVRDTFDRKYADTISRISGERRRAQLAAVTTSSALGRSSVYNRLRRADGTAAMSAVGYSSGSGDFQFSGPIYNRLVDIASTAIGDQQTQRHTGWGGTSFRNRREVIQVALRELGLDGRRLRSHGVRRELFVGFTAPNAGDFLRGETDTLDRREHNTVDDVSDWWKTRWAIPRAGRTPQWRHADPAGWRLFT